MVVGVLRYYLEACTFDIARLDSLTVNEAVQRFDATVQIEYIFSVEITIIINRVIVVSCPGSPHICSGQGSCVDGLCVCNSGYSYTCIGWIIIIIFIIITNEKIKVMLSRKRCRGTLQDYNEEEISKCQSKLWTNRNVFSWCLNGTREETVR